MGQTPVPARFRMQSVRIPYSTRIPCVASTSLPPQESVAAYTATIPARTNSNAARPADHKIGDRKPVQILSCRQQIHHRRDAACIIGQQFLSPAQGNAVSGKKLPCAFKISHGRAPRYQPAAADR